MKKRYSILICLCLAMSPAMLDAQVINRPLKGGLVEQLYARSGNRLLWLCDSCATKRSALLHTIGKAEEFGLNVSDYQLKRLEQLCGDDSMKPELSSDKAISEIAIRFCSDLYEGTQMDNWVSYDGVGSQYASFAADTILLGLLNASDSSSLTQFIASLEPQDAEYCSLKQALSLDSGDGLCRKQLKSSLNYYRWIHHFHADSFVVVNIPSATLRYYRSDSLLLEMRAVVGKASNHTPRFSAYIREVTLYPYWNMPRSILVNEWLRNFRKNPGLVDFMSMEVIDKRGKVVPAADINWRKASTSGFPYRVREKPGCSNPMGVLKFSLTSPFDIYLHDTNFKGAFLAKNRFYSHGCVRIEAPVALADAILVQKVDADFLAACLKDQQPQVIKLEHPVPVFVVYMCAEADSAGQVYYYNDVYGLLK